MSAVLKLNGTFAVYEGQSFMTENAIKQRKEIWVNKHLVFLGFNEQCFKKAFIDFCLKVNCTQFQAISDIKGTDVLHVSRVQRYWQWETEQLSRCHFRALPDVSSLDVYANVEDGAINHIKQLIQVVR